VADGGFALGTSTDDAAKSDVAYRGRNELLIGTDFSGDGSEMTDSGYPRVVKSWKRGTPLSEVRTAGAGAGAAAAAAAAGGGAAAASPCYYHCCVC